MRLVSRYSVAAGMAVALVATTALGAGAAASSAQPQYGGTIIYALPAQTNIPWYFPLRNNANASLYTSELTDLLYQPLLYVNDALAIDYTQSIASKVTFNSQGTVFNVYMNPKWKWSNGQAITSADAQFGWDVLIATEESTTAPWPSSDLGSGNLPQNAKSFKVDGPYEFTVTLKSPVNQEWFIYTGLGTIPVLPTAWNKYPSSITQEIAYLGKEATNPDFDSIVSGPFKLQSAVQNQAWTLVPNTNYSGQKPYVSRLILQYESSDTAEFAALKTGSIQVGYLPAAEYNARAELPDRMVTAYPFSYRFVWGDLNKGAEGGVNTIFDNFYVREALMEGIDTSAINSAIWHGYGAEENGPIPSEPATKFLDPALAKPLYSYNPAAGKALLEKNGWQEVDGVMTKGSQKMSFSLMFPSGNLATTLEMELLQADWAQEGIQVTLDQVPFATLVGNLSEPSKWEMVSGIGIIYGSYPSGDTLFYKLQGLDADLGYNDPTENALVQATTLPAASAAASLQAFYKYEYYTAKELPALWLPNEAAWDEVAPDVHGFNAYTDNWVTGDFLPQYWWVSSS